MCGKSLFSGFALMLLLVAVTSADPGKEDPDVVTIPLDEIWAYEMPGTRDVRQLEPEHFGRHIKKLNSDEQLKSFESSMTSAILQSLSFNKHDQVSRQGFAVSETGIHALREASAVLSTGRKPQDEFTEDSDISIVFFSHLFGYYVHLDRVNRESNNVRIWYRFVPHETKELTRHFALIPLGSFSSGEVKVEIRRSPMKKTLVDAGFKAPGPSAESRVIAQPFQFQVKSERKD